MSGNKTMTVLAPNGRRQVVKVSPNTTILQVLEEVCQKQGFQPEEYDIKHHNHVLDTTSLIRFSGLPNNAQLEMAKIKKTREESNVVLGLQLESGDRLTGTFTPTDTLWDVVKKLCPDEADPDSNPVVIYMRKEICGADNLTKTTLRSLGLTGGRAMVRFIHRTAEELRHQANISGFLPKRTVVEEKPGRGAQDISDTPPETPESLKVTFVTAESSSPPETPEQLKMPSVTAASSPLLETGNSKLDSNPCEVNSVDQITPSESMDVDSCDFSVESSPSEVVLAERKREVPLTEPIILLGERNAIVFNPTMAHAVPYQDLPEDFFNLTVDDVRSLYRDLKDQRSEMEDNPFMTRAMRELNESKRVLRHLNQYRRVVLRIQFPNQTVLQGTFTPLETISTVADFVREYLEDPASPFHLYTTPPKVILPPEARLVDVNCVPCAVIHFGRENPADVYLREDLLSQFTSPTAATMAACQSRGLFPAVVQSSSAETPSTCPAPVMNSSQSPSSEAVPISNQSVPRHPNRTREGEPNSKVPKWFKTGK